MYVTAVEVITINAVLSYLVLRSTRRFLKSINLALGDMPEQ